MLALVSQLMCLDTTKTKTKTYIFSMDCSSSTFPTAKSSKHIFGTENNAFLFNCYLLRLSFTETSLPHLLYNFTNFWFFCSPFVCCLVPYKPHSCSHRCFTFYHAAYWMRNLISDHSPASMFHFKYYHGSLASFLLLTIFFFCWIL